MKTAFCLIMFGVILGALLGVIFYKNHSLDYYEDTYPQVDIKDYFTGPIKAWGIVQDWRGRVVRRFDVHMFGMWEGDKGTLKEQFAYYDGHTQERIWTITKHEDGRYEGRASDIIGHAVGKTQGSAVRWNYVMDLRVGDATYRIRFDDWMWLMHDGVLVNRSYLKKFGIPVAELTLFMQKQK